MTEPQTEPLVEIPDYKDWMYIAATENCSSIGLVLDTIPPPVEGEDPRIERNSEESEPGSMVPPSTPVRVVLYPPEPKQ